MEATSPRICFPARSQCLERIRNFCREILQVHTPDQGLHRKLVLAIDEAVANVIEHAYSATNGEGVSTIELSIEVRPEKIIIRILDHGIPFDPSAGEGDGKQTFEGNGESGTVLPGTTEVEVSPSARRSLSNFHRRGFGLQLIRLIMDEIDYKRTPQGENLLVLTKRLKKGCRA